MAEEKEIKGLIEKDFEHLTKEEQIAFVSLHIDVLVDVDTLEAQIRLLEDAVDDYLDVSPNIMSNEEAAHRLDMASNLKRLSKKLQILKFGIES
jgi:hypothetical protein